MAFPRKLLNVGEEIVLDLRPHWVTLAVPVVLVVVASALGIVAAAVEWPAPVLVVALVLVVAAVVNLGLRLLGWSSTQLVLTTDRLISRSGVLTKSGIEIPLERINTVFFNQRILERMVGSGDLAIESAGERGNQTFNNVRKPAMVQREIYVQMEANENRKFDRIAAPSAALSPVEQVERLHDLLLDGAITEEQFEAEKARILGS